MDPQSALIAKAHQLTGRTLGSFENIYGSALPANTLRKKGIVGQLLEILLGADGHNLPAPDFSALGIELKTLPITPSGKILETTFVSTVKIPFREVDFNTSSVALKLKKVLFVPYIPKQPLCNSIIERAFLFEPTPTQWAILQRDWEELTECLRMGDTSITARMGQVLHLRPKAANSSQRVKIITPEGVSWTVPKAFYLRTNFTQLLLEDHL